MLRKIHLIYWWLKIPVNKWKLFRVNYHIPVAYIKMCLPDEDCAETITSMVKELPQRGGCLCSSGLLPVDCVCKQKNIIKWLQSINAIFPQAVKWMLRLSHDWMLFTSMVKELPQRGGYLCSSGLLPVDCVCKQNTISSYGFNQSRYRYNQSAGR
jgi:hypothetical protein